MSALSLDIQQERKKLVQQGAVVFNEGLPQMPGMQP